MAVKKKTKKTQKEKGIIDGIVMLYYLISTTDCYQVKSTNNIPTRWNLQ